MMYAPWQPALRCGTVCLIAGILLSASGCGSGGSREVARGGARAAARGAGIDLRLSEGYGLLHSLLSKQGGVDGILLVKGTSDRTAELVKELAEVSRLGTQRIKSFAKQDDRLRVDWTGLREAEARARAQIEGATGKALLFAGQDFEVRLLLTQSEAIRYGVGLANVLLKWDKQPGRITWLQEFIQRYEALGVRVVGRLSVVSDS